MSLEVYILSFVPNGEHQALPTIDGFNQMLGALSSFDEAVDCMKSLTEDDEVFIDFDLRNDLCTYFYTNYGTYKIQRTMVWFPS